MGFKNWVYRDVEMPSNWDEIESELNYLLVIWNHEIAHLK